MNILFDVSLLGRGGSGAGCVTGMPRYVEELARSLLHRRDCTVALCAGTRDSEALAVLAAHAGLRDAPFVDLATVAPGEWDVYHTPHAPIPEVVRQCPNLAAVQTVHDMIPFLMPETLPASYVEYYADMMGRLRPESDVVVTVSDSTRRDFLARIPFPPERVFVTPLAADLRRFTPRHVGVAAHAVREKYGIPGGPYLLSLCTFEPRKNLDRVIRGFLDLAATEPALGDLTLVLAGRVGWKPEGILAELTGSDRIHVTGYVADPDLPTLYAGALAFVYLSLYEGFGLPVLEAMGCGTPVITSNTSSLPEVAGYGAILVDPLDEDAFKQAVLSVVQDAGRREALAAAGLERAREFSWERCADTTVVAYREAVRMGCKGSRRVNSGSSD